MEQNQLQLENLPESIQERISHWLKENYDNQSKDQIYHLLETGQTEALEDAFYKDLDFGTGGLRGIMGVGTNRINKYTIGSATQGVCNYLKSTYPEEEIKVAIAYDSRNNADYFAQITADVFSANGIIVYLFDELKPTPELSFAVRHLNCKGGVMLTASHNPKEYSGYKTYWADGGQVLPPHDKNIITEVKKIDSISKIKFEANPENIRVIGSEMDETYLRMLSKFLPGKVSPELKSNLKIVFSPIHGTAVRIIPQALKMNGYTNLHLVEEQCTVDGNFPTVIYPNPEEQEALALSLKKAKAVNADLVMATDPDADRVGIAVKKDSNEYILLNGNQTAVLIMHFMLDFFKNSEKQAEAPYIVKTIVTTPLIDKMATAMNIKCYNVLTGFKYIGEIITKLEGKGTFIAGAEESYGYLIGDHVRDKDAVIACCLIAEMGAYYKNQDMSLLDVLKQIYLKYGFYKEELISLTKPGKKGSEEIKTIIEEFRNHPPKSLGGSKVIKVIDYLHSKEKDPATGKTQKVNLPPSDVIQFITAENYVISARPSGTEPKIKFYFSVNAKLESVAGFLEKDEELNALIEQISKGLMD